MSDQESASDDRVRWTATGETTLDSLLSVAGWSTEDMKANGVPWELDHELQIRAWGGIYSRDDRRVTIVPGTYNSQVFGSSDVDVRGDLHLRVRNLTEWLKSGPNTASAHRKDKIEVQGDMEWTTEERLTMMSGTVTRLWEGGIQRYVGMEGVICGGAFVKTFVGPSATVSGLVSGDVYGGCARLAGARVYLAGINYRSVNTAVWVMGAYIRNTAITIEPILNTPSAISPQGNALLRAGKLAMNLCPFLDIAVGVIMAPVGLILLIASLVRRKPPQPPSGPARTRTRTIGGQGVHVRLSSTKQYV